MNPHTLTAVQRRTLKVWLTYRDKPMTLPSVLWWNRGHYLSLLGLFALADGLTYISSGWLAAAIIAVGFGFAMLRDVGYLIQAIDIFPMLRQTLDWSKVEALAIADGARMQGHS